MSSSEFIWKSTTITSTYDISRHILLITSNVGVMSYLTFWRSTMQFVTGSCINIFSFPKTWHYYICYIFVSDFHQQDFSLFGTKKKKCVNEIYPQAEPYLEALGTMIMLSGWNETS